MGYFQFQNCERLAKQLESQLTDMTLKSDEQARLIQELTMGKSKMHNENSDLNRQLEDAESQLAALNRIKQQQHSQLEELKRQLEQESRERSTLHSQVSLFCGKQLIYLESANGFTKTVFRCYFLPKKISKLN